MVNRRRLAASVVALIAFVAAVLTMLPGVAYWDTGELQAVAPLLGTAHPTGFPTYVLIGWLASVVLQPFGEPAFRMNLLSGLCLAVAAGCHGRPRAGTDRSAGDRDRGRHRDGPDPDRLGDRDPRRGAHPSPGARGGPALAPGRVGREGPLPRRRPTRPGRPLPACRDGHLRAGRRQPFAHPAAGDPGRAVRARRRPGDLATRPARPVVHRPARWDRRPRLSRAAPARRAVPGGPRVRHAEHAGTASATSSSPSSSRAACPIRSASCRASSASSSTARCRSTGSWPRSSRSRSS